MGSINLKHTGSGSDIALSSDGTNLLLDGTAIGGGGGGADLYAANESSPTAQPSATGTNSIAIGDSAISTGTSSLAGPYSRASGYNSVAFGIQDTTTSYGSQSSGMAVGEKARNSASKSMAFGDYSVASGSNSAAHGRLASSGGIFAMAFGFNSSASHQRSTAIGNAASSHATSGVAIGGSGYSVKISGSYTLPTADGSANQVLTTNGSGVSSWAAAGGSSDYVHISTQTVTSATAQVEFDLSNSDYGSYYIVAHDCAFTAAPTNEYCLYFNLYEGAYSSSAPWTNRMSLYYAQGVESGSTVSTSSSWTYNLTMRSGSTPTTSTKFGFSGMIGGRTNSPVDLNGYFVTGTSAVGAPRIRGIAPNTSNNMTYMLVKPSTTTFASGKFSLYGLKDA